MKLKRVVALMLAASMLAAVAGCSKVKKVTGADFVAACEKIGAEEVDYEDMNEVEESDLEDGVYSVLDSDDIEDGLDDLLRKINVDIDDLSQDEYKLNKNSLYLRLHVSVEDFIEVLMESDFYDALLETSPDDDEAEELEEALQNITGDISLAVYVSDGNILFIIGASLNCEPSFINEFCREAGVDDPTDIPSSEAVTEALIDTLDDYAALLTARSSYNTDYSLYDF